jgi:hypothetical protein
MTAFELIQAVLVFIMLAVAIWFCSRSPLWLAKFIDKEVIGNTDVSSYYRPTREFIAYIREHPESWHLRYPRVLRAIRLTGWWAFIILAVNLLMIFLVSIGVVEVSGPGVSGR